VKHLRTVSRTPQLAEQSTSDLSFLLSLLGLFGTLFGTFSTSFVTLFQGVLTALTAFNNLKNPNQT